MKITFQKCAPIRDMLTDQLNIHNALMANKMNDIMKTLTIFAATFIPLTFVAGIYGTSFEYLPELHYKYSYFIFWGILIIIASVLLIYFKRKRWFYTRDIKFFWLFCLKKLVLEREGQCYDTGKNLYSGETTSCENVFLSGIDIFCPMQRG